MAEIQKSPDRTAREWYPFTDFDLLRQQFEDIARLPSPWFRWPHVEFVPLADIEETDEAWVVEVELPGVSKKDIEVEVHGRTVVIAGERKEKERTGVVRQKRRVTGSFRYEVTLPGDFDDAAVEASLANGELTLRLPKSEADQPHKIRVS